MAQSLEEVVVTAQRRAENQQDVALAVTSVNSNQLQDSQVFNVENINAISPSISFRNASNAGTSANLQIRGVGTTGTARVFEGAVGVFIDGVYRSRAGAALAQFLDIEQLQVLRGPQGTLFGKNTSAGALLLDSTRPDVEEMSGFVGIELGNYDKQLIRGAINTPIGDQAALRVAAVKTSRDGYYDDPNGGTVNYEDSVGVKAQLLVNISDTTEVRVIADYSNQDNDCCYGTSEFIDGPLRPLINSLTLANGLSLPSSKLSDREVSMNFETETSTKDYGLGFYLETELDAGTLKFISAGRVFDTEQSLSDSDFSGADILPKGESLKSEFFSAELSFTGSLEGDIQAEYVVGAYYSDEDLTYGRELYWGQQAQTYWDAVFGVSGLANAAPGLFSLEDMASTANSAAIFTQWDFTLSDRLNLILGARYSEDEKDGSFQNPYFRDSLFDPLALAGSMPGIEYDQSFDDSSVSGTITLKYQLSDDAMMYASYNRGYKAGGIGVDSSAGGTPGSVILGSPGSLSDPEFGSETTDAYEIGLKSDWLDGAARTNMAAFYTDITDLQIGQFSGLAFTIDNAPSAESYGLEIEQLFQLGRFWTVSAAATWLPEAHYSDDEVMGSIAGRRFALAPEVAANLALAADFPVTSELDLKGRIEAVYTGDMFTGSSLNLKQDAVTIVNGTMSLASTNSGWKVGAFVQNLTDETYVTIHFAAPLQSGSINSYLGSPRTFGLNAQYSF